MLADALADDQLISMSVFSPGWQKALQGNPPLEPFVCLGQIISHTTLPDGCSNVLLIGQRRAKILEELPEVTPYRSARVEILSDIYDDDASSCGTASSQARSALQLELMQAFEHVMPKSALAAGQLTQSLGSQLTLGILTDLISYSLDLSVQEKQQLLAERRVDVRARRLLKHFRSLTAKHDPPPVNPCFPPDFSAN